MALKMVSLMAENGAFHYRNLARYLSRRLEQAIEVVEDVPWQERERMLDRGDAHLGFVCGLPYVRKADQRDCHLELLCAPVMRASRYAGRPVYYSDVIVRQDSHFRSFDCLRGASWAYNEPGSQSGYNITRYYLATLGECGGYFGRAVEAGAHQRSIRMVISGEVDASAIDSTVLELELRQHPELAPHLRVVHTLGPSPIPPGVISRHVPLATRRAVRDTLLRMHEDPEGSALLAEAGLARYIPTRDEDYDEIRHMARTAERAHLGHDDPALPRTLSVA